MVLWVLRLAGFLGTFFRDMNGRLVWVSAIAASWMLAAWDSDDKVSTVRGTVEAVICETAERWGGGGGATCIALSE